MSSESQILVAALEDPARYPHPVEAVERLETHISWVLLAGEYAYKIKKPVDLGFLDFSSREKRRHFCAEELRLNRRLAPTLYLRVAAITGTPADPHLDGEGEPIEHAVVMARFDQARLLDRQLAAGRLTPEDMDAVGARIAAFHRAADVAGADTPYGTPEKVRAPVSENFTQIRPLLSDPQDLARLERLETDARERYRDLDDTFAARKAAGAVRECHGDLHLGNMARLDDGITAFDCIEFSPDLRWIDVMSETAFLVMDLLHRGRRDLAYRFLNTYLAWTGDYDGVAVLPYYLAYRAMVRAKVSALRMGQAEGEARDKALAVYRDYAHYAEHPEPLPPPSLILTRGVSGSGKTWLARRVSEQLPGLHLRSDVERKRLFGLAPDARTEAGIDAGIYAPEAGDRTYSRLWALAGILLEHGHPAIVDATFLEPRRLEPFTLLARSRGIPCVVLDCHADPAVLHERVRARHAVGSDASEADAAVLDHQLAGYAPLGGDVEASVVGVDTGARDALQRALAAVRERVGSAAATAGAS